MNPLGSVARHQGGSSKTTTAPVGAPSDRDWLVASDGGVGLGWHALPPGSDPGPRPAGEQWPLYQGTAACGHRDSFHHGDDDSIFSALWRCAACCQATGTPPGAGRPRPAGPDTAPSASWRDRDLL